MSPENAWDEEGFWKRLSRRALARAWGKEDRVWDKFAEKDLQ